MITDIVIIRLILSDLKRHGQLSIMGEGQNYENQNVENQKELRKPCKPSQRRKELLKRSER